jgi:TRAP-type C4-dicarboxylate transport system substrate-binding protein
MTTPLFTKRHYEWLAAFAKDNLDRKQVQELGRQLTYTNPAFNLEWFTNAAGWYDKLAQEQRNTFPAAGTPAQRREAARLRRVG